MRVTTEEVEIKNGHSVVDYIVEMGFVDGDSGYQRTEHIVADNRYEAIGKAILRHTGEPLPLSAITVFAAVHSE